jgi:hypothetical protein
MEPEELDIWSSLPPELACIAVSNITDISDISRSLQTSNIFRQYTFCIQNLTSNKVLLAPSSFLDSFINVKTADHKIVFIVTENDLNKLNSLIHLRQADFVLRNFNLLSSLFQNLKGLNFPEHYFKIILDSPDGCIGILISNGNFLILPDNNYQQQIGTLIINTKPNLISTMLPDIGVGIEGNPGFKLWKNPMREFLLFSDFGLVDPTQPPSEINRPLSEYIRLVSDGANVTLLYKILTIYIRYHGLSQGTLINSDQTMRRYFEHQIEKNRDKHPNFNLSAMLYANLTIIISLNSINTPLNIEDIAEYDFPNYIPSLEDIRNVTNVVNVTRTLYQNLLQEAKNTKGVGFYDKDGNIRYLS